MAHTQRGTNKRLGAVLVEQVMLEAARRLASPRGNALFDVLRQLLQVVPKLDDSSGCTLRIPIVDGWLTLGSLDQSSDEFRALSMVFRAVRHFFATRSIIYWGSIFFCHPECVLYAHGMPFRYGERRNVLPERRFNRLGLIKDSSEVTAT